MPEHHTADERMSEAAKFERLIREHCEGFVSIDSEISRVLMKHYELLRIWNRRLNLTSVSGLEEAAVRHYAESLFLASLVPDSARRVADLGSGGGFPGFPLAVLRPNVEVVLIEADQRKVAFLREVSDFALNVRVRCIRVESLDGLFDGVVGRAIRPADVLTTARRIAGWFGILLSLRDAEVLAGSVDSQVRPLPWDSSSAALVGIVPRETLRSG
jgi:16S rRNA (guanine(527)-N(7))-methyltransferase RsmG